MSIKKDYQSISDLFIDMMCGVYADNAVCIPISKLPRDYAKKISIQLSKARKEIEKTKVVYRKISYKKIGEEIVFNLSPVFNCRIEEGVNENGNEKQTSKSSATSEERL